VSVRVVVVGSRMVLVLRIAGSLSSVRRGDGQDAEKYVGSGVEEGSKGENDD
jgi:hypothetical protein